MAISGDGPFLSEQPKLHGTSQEPTRTWQRTLARARVPYFRIYDLRSTYATRLSGGGVPDEWVTQMLRQGDAHVFKKYSQTKLQMKREALEKTNRQASEIKAQGTPGLCTAMAAVAHSCTVCAQSGPKVVLPIRSNVGKCFRMDKRFMSGRSAAW
jgi:hypothetical protein